MTENPKFETTKKDAENKDMFPWGFFSGLKLLRKTPILQTDTAKSKSVTMEKLIDMSRGLPQIGSNDPAGNMERLMALTKTKKVTKKETPKQTLETIQPETVRPKRGIIRKIFDR